MITESAHRPYPPPVTAWVAHMTWNDLLTAHWALPPETLQRVLPSSVPVDTYDGRAYLTLAARHLTEVRPRGVPALPWLSAFAELQVRTYVTLDGQPGVYAFSLDAASVAAVAGGRAVYFLPYFLAAMSVEHEGGWVQYSSHRSRWLGSPAHFIARYRPAGEVFTPPPGSLEHWLSERYCLYAVDSRDQVFRTQIHHAASPLQPAEAVLFRNTMTTPMGIELPEAPDRLHYVKRLEVAMWLPEGTASQTAPS